MNDVLMAHINTQFQITVVLNRELTPADDHDQLKAYLERANATSWWDPEVVELNEEYAVIKANPQESHKGAIKQINSQVQGVFRGYNKHLKKEYGTVEEVIESDKRHETPDKSDFEGRVNHTKTNKRRKNHDLSTQEWVVEREHPEKPARLIAEHTQIRTITTGYEPEEFVERSRKAARKQNALLESGEPPHRARVGIEEVDI